MVNSTAVTAGKKGIWPLIYKSQLLTFSDLALP